MFNETDVKRFMLIETAVSSLKHEMFNLSDYTEFVDDKEAPDGKCVYFNGTHGKILLDVYEGIPENLILNFIGWLILILLFAVLRKRAWNYGRLALVQKNETNTKWTQLFYGSVDEVAGVSDNDTNSLSSVESSFIDKGFCSWIIAVFKIRKEEILRRCGPDALQYLSFQRYIIFYMFIMMIISLVIVLPINFQGDLQGDEKTFGHTTVSNLEPNSPFLWVHVIIAVLYLPLAIFIMRKFSVKAKIQETDLNVSRVLMVTNIPKRACDIDDLYKHFREAYPEVSVMDISLAYDITQLSKLEKERAKMTQSKIYCKNYLKRTNIRLDMRPYACGNVCGCCDIFGCPKVDAIEYYVNEEHRLIDEVETQKAAALKKPVGIAFVTFNSAQDAKKVLADFKSYHSCGCNVGSSSLNGQLKPYRWHVQCSPPKNDIFWENLSFPTKFWYIRAFFINILLFIVLFFFTTPVYVVNLLNMMQLTNKIKNVNPVVSRFLPTLIMWTVAALLPVLVSYSDQWLAHWTRSSHNHSVMRKTFTFLLLMVIILPSVGLTSAQAFFDSTLHWRNETYRWECLFLPDKGAFFVNYITTSAFIGTGLELIRFPELFLYAVRLCLARSEAETVSVRKAILWEFPFGVQYAWMLLIFAMTKIYSLSCPLITPFGILYMVMKHFVDKYNLFFAYGPSKISSHIHASAINIVIFSVVLLQTSFVALSFFRNGLHGITIFCLFGLSLTLLFFFFHVFFSLCKGFSPIAYQNRKNSSPESSPSKDPDNIRFVSDLLELQHRRTSDASDENSGDEVFLEEVRNYGSGANSGTDGLFVPCSVGSQA